ncbi:MAG: class I SAM-dependent methyltransferase family protein [Candidatus Micrarchaeota archaeon]
MKNPKTKLLKKKPSSLREALEGKLTEEQLSELVTSFDIIGTVVVIDIPESLKKKEKVIGNAILDVHRHLKTVCKRSGIHEGDFRIRPVEVIAGGKSTETEYKECGALMRFDINKTYFTPRLSHERERIAAFVKPGEKIGYFFAGVGPFGFVILKKQPAVGKIYAFELNPSAVEYMENNIRINRAQLKMQAVAGDVRKEAPKYAPYDRIVMPLPKDAHEFLDVALACSKKGTIVHLYGFGERSKPFEELEKSALNCAKLRGIKISVQNRKIVRPYSPSTVQVVFDLAVL